MLDAHWACKTVGGDLVVAVLDRGSLRIEIAGTIDDDGALVEEFGKVAEFFQSPHATNRAENGQLAIFGKPNR